MEFEKLEVRYSSNIFKRIWGNPHYKRTIIFSVIGAVVAIFIYLVTNIESTDLINTTGILKSIGIGAFWGIFMTNSPCARGKC